MKKIAAIVIIILVFTFIYNRTIDFKITNLTDEILKKENNIEMKKKELDRIEIYLGMIVFLPEDEDYDDFIEEETNKTIKKYQEQKNEVKSEIDFLQKEIIILKGLKIAYSNSKNYLIVLDFIIILLAGFIIIKSKKK